MDTFPFVTPAKAGVQSFKPVLEESLESWMPAFAGMTDELKSIHIES